MNYNHSHKNSSTVGIRLMCATVFCLFSFLYLYFFQADVLAAAQYVLSKGMTRYNHLAGAVIITLVLQFLQVIVYAFTRLWKRSHALTYLPSMLALAAITDVNTDGSHVFSVASWWWVLLLLLVVWVGAVLFAKALQEVEPKVEAVGLFSRAMWINLLAMALMIIVVVAISNTNAVYHYRMRAETCLLRGDYQGGLKTGEESLETDTDLQMIRMYALTRTGELAERLFNYPVAGNSASMLPVEGASKFVMYPVDSLYSDDAAGVPCGIADVHLLRASGVLL